MKKTLFILIVLCLLFITGGTAFADESDFTFDADTATITAYSGAGGAVVIPDEIGGIAVLKLGDYLFRDNADITSVVIPAGITLLPNQLFYSCHALESVTLPEGLSAIGGYVFYDCTALKEIVLPARIAFIGESAFAVASNLNHITFLGGVPYISAGAFWYAWEDEEALTVDVPVGLSMEYAAALEVACHEHGAAAPEIDRTPAEEEIDFDAATGTILSYTGNNPVITIPESIGGVSVTAIGEKAFQHNAVLRLMRLPDAISSIGAEAFMGSSIVALNMPASLSTIGTEAFLWSRLASDLVLPEGVTDIPDKAFKGTDITSVTFRKSIKTIGAEAFGGCYTLTYILFEARELPEMAADAFISSGLTDVDISDDATKAEEVAAREKLLAAGMKETVGVWRANLSNQPAYPEGDGSMVFDTSSHLITGYTGSMTELTAFWNFYVGDDVTAVKGVGEKAFAGSDIRRFTVPRSNQFAIIGDSAFEDSQLAQIDLFDSITTIGAAAFRNCQNLTEMTLPDSIESIGAGAFENCANLTKLVIPANIPITEDALAGVPYSAIFLPEDTDDETVQLVSAKLNRPINKPVLRIGEMYMPPLTMPDTENAESDFEFDAQTGGITAYLGDSPNVVVPRSIGGVPVRVISENAFSAFNFTTYDKKVYEWLETVVLPETVTVIERNAFLGCTGLKSVACYGELESIGSRAFETADALSEVHFYGGVKFIGEFAFNFATALKTIDLGGILETTGEGAFHSSGLEHIVADMRIIGPKAFGDCEKLAQVHIPPRVESVESAAFNGCTGLNILCIEEYSEGLFQSKDYGIFAGTPETMKIIVPASVSDDVIQTLEKTLKNVIQGFSGTIEKGSCNRAQTPPRPIVIKVEDLPEIAAALAPIPQAVPASTSMPEAPVQEDENEEMPIDTQPEWMSSLVSLFMAAGTRAETSETTAVPIDAPAATPVPTPVPTSAPASTAESASSSMPDFKDITFTLIAAEDMEGNAFPIEYLGRYDVIFYPDGTCTMTIGGVAMPGGTWVDNETEIAVDYYTVPFIFKRDGAGFKMNYYDAMILTYEAE